MPDHGLRTKDSPWLRHAMFAPGGQPPDAQFPTPRSPTPKSARIEAANPVEAGLGWLGLLRLVGRRTDRPRKMQVSFMDRFDGLVDGRVWLEGGHITLRRHARNRHSARVTDHGKIGRLIIQPEVVGTGV
jgi:hypothetical protein